MIAEKQKSIRLQQRVPINYIIILGRRITHTRLQNNRCIKVDLISFPYQLCIKSKIAMQSNKMLLSTEELKSYNKTIHIANLSNLSKRFIEKLLSQFNI